MDEPLGTPISNVVTGAAPPADRTLERALSLRSSFGLLAGLGGGLSAAAAAALVLFLLPLAVLFLLFAPALRRPVALDT